MQEPLLPQHQVTDPVDKPLPPDLEFSASLPHSHQKGGPTWPPVTNSCPTLCSSISPRTCQPQTTSSEGKPRPPSPGATPVLHLTTAPQPHPLPATGAHHQGPHGRRADSCTCTRRQRGPMHHTPAWHTQKSQPGSVLRVPLSGGGGSKSEPKANVHPDIQGTRLPFPKPAPEEQRRRCTPT